MFLTKISVDEGLLIEIYAVHGHPLTNVVDSNTGTEVNQANVLLYSVELHILLELWLRSATRAKEFESSLKNLNRSAYPSSKHFCF